MIAKHCAACRHFFHPNKVGLANIFCHPCMVRCEEAYHQIRQYIKEHPGASSTKIVLQLKIPAVFVNHLFRLGRFNQAFSTQKTPQSNRQCTVCRKILQPHEDVYCQPCNQIIDNRLHSRYQHIIQKGMKTPFEQNTASAKTPGTDKKDILPKR